MKAVLALADGRLFEGEGFGARVDVAGEVVFNTAMSGYQETLTDPSYVGQLVTFTCPHIGNVGVNAHDEESARPHAVGAIVREYTHRSNWRASDTLHGYLEKHGLPGISGLDTRALVRHLRTHGAQQGVLSTSGASAQALVERAKASRPMEGLDLATGISTRAAYEWTAGTPDPLTGAPAKPTTGRYHVVAVDYGLKRSMLQYLCDVGARVTVVPASETAAQILARKPDGVFLTNGPGDPAAVVGARETVAALLGKVPVFGICLGHQILALALGGSTYKLKFGHRGANQPVKDLSTGKVEITAQNHGFAVDARSLEGRAVVTHVNLNDGTVEGIAAEKLNAFSVQHHPESSPGPHDARSLFQRFAQAIDKAKAA
ncbi:MAG: glutamine-hydrolyzing carbamoyl-phosphate synthase small subunit [Myxococcaceae bacterium]|nr:glutamine-hydrolyzing carbamoyl-phosphate synthase small subunit [Myxococcaceae bacterium]